MFYVSIISVHHPYSSASFQKEIVISIDNQEYIYDHSNKTRFWIEVYFSDIGWVSYDPRGMHFGITSHLIKFSAGPDSDYVSSDWGIDKEIADIQEDLGKQMEGFFDRYADQEYNLWRGGTTKAGRAIPELGG